MRIAVVGGGATGALAAVHIARRLGGGADIALIEPASDPGKGLAYSTRDPRHLLNVRVANMSAFPDEPDHLQDWLKRRRRLEGGRCPTPFCFISRSTYGDYIGELVGDVMEAGLARHLRDVCVDLAETAYSVTLKLKTGRSIVADRVVLATGHDVQPTLFGIPAEPPWADGALDGLAPEAPVLIVGSGLTMVDMALALDRRGHRGPITAVSRRGLLPLAHREIAPCRIDKVPFGMEVSELLAWLRRSATQLMAAGGDWRSTVDAVRPHTQRLWRSMTVEQKRRFLRHARAYWDVHRHRMAPEIEAQIAALRSTGRLAVVAGRVLSAAKQGDLIYVRILRRNERTPEEHCFARVIDCSGLPSDPTRSKNPLIRSLLASGSARVDPLGIGLDVTQRCAIIDARGNASRRVHAIGPLARAALWECVAIPDIRAQCRELAESLRMDMDEIETPEIRAVEA